MKNGIYHGNPTFRLIVKTALITTVTVILLTLAIGGVRRWSQNFPTPQTSAVAVFTEKDLAGIRSDATAGAQASRLQWTRKRSNRVARL